MQFNGDAAGSTGANNCGQSRQNGFHVPDNHQKFIADTNAYRIMDRDGHRVFSSTSFSSDAGASHRERSITTASAAPVPSDTQQAFVSARPFSMPPPDGFGRVLLKRRCPDSESPSTFGSIGRASRPRRLPGRIASWHPHVGRKETRRVNRPRHLLPPPRGYGLQSHRPPYRSRRRCRRPIALTAHAVCPLQGAESSSAGAGRVGALTCGGLSCAGSSMAPPSIRWMSRWGKAISMPLL